MRVACVRVRAPYLQWMSRGARARATQRPCVVFDRADARGVVVERNIAAARFGVRLGMKRRAARTLCAGAMCWVIDPRETERSRERIAAALHRTAARVQVCEQERGVYWVDGSGMSAYHGSWSAWGEVIVEGLRELGLVASVVIGFGVTPTRLLSRARRGVFVFEDAVSEQAALRALPISALGGRLTSELWAVGIEHIGELMGRSASSLAERFGVELARLHAGLFDQRGQLLDRCAWVQELDVRVEVDAALTDQHAILARIMEAWPRLEAKFRSKALVPALVEFVFEEDHGAGRAVFEIRPVYPTDLASVFFDLLALRLARTGLAWPVGAILMRCELGAPRSEQQVLGAAARRDAGAMEQLIGKLQAIFGAHACARGESASSHFLEEQNHWRYGEVPARAVGKGASSGACDLGDGVSLVRAVLDDPRRVRRVNDGALRARHVVGSAWSGEGDWREYGYVIERRGKVVIVYRDMFGGAWFEHGEA